MKTQAEARINPTVMRDALIFRRAAGTAEDPNTGETIALSLSMTDGSPLVEFASGVTVHFPWHELVAAARLAAGGSS